MTVIVVLCTRFAVKGKTYYFAIQGRSWGIAKTVEELDISVVSKACFGGEEPINKHFRGKNEQNQDVSYQNYLTH